MTQLTIKFKEDQTGQLKLLFPDSPSANQELLETLKTEYNQTWLSEVEKQLLKQQIEDEKNRLVKPL